MSVEQKDKQAPEVLSISVKVRCTCGEDYDFDTEDLMPFGVMSSLSCEGCGQRISVDCEIFTQYLPALEQVQP